ncbi:MAG TPA: DUF2723 domain-containing protein [Longimicrobiales bacterium]|nr:DUF2723 domain-containing protein [Longimicrobiales bacterium]
MAGSRQADVPGAARAAPIAAGEAYRPPYLAAGIATLIVWLLYAVTLSRTTAFWDTSEYIATAHILGIPHPPGNPLFVVLARAWEVLLAPTGLSVAIRINLFSATMSALAHGCWFLLAHRVLAFFSTDRLFRLVGASAAMAISATAFTVWNQSNVNEKVYTVSLFTIALLSWLAFRWRDSRTGGAGTGVAAGKDDNLLLLMVFILALSVGNHLMAFLVAPALVLFILMSEPRTFANWRLYVGAIAITILGLSIHLYLPLRAGLDPIINEADPSCPSVWSAIGSVVTYGGAGCDALSEALAREQYSKPSIMTDPTDPRLEASRGISLIVAQFGNWLQYFDWQWARSVDGMDPLFGAGRWFFTLLFGALGVTGAIAHYRRERPTFWYVLVLFATLSLGLVFYLNFKYGYSYGDIVQGGVSREAREVRERDYFFIVGFSIWGVWAGIGLAHLWTVLAERLARARPELPPRRRLALASPLLGLALVPLVLNYDWARRDNDYAARDWAYNLLMSVEPYSVLFTNGDNDTFPLWYVQEVEGVRRDVTVIVMSYLNTPWYVEQLRDLTAPCDPGESPNRDSTRIVCQRPFDRETGPSFYAAQLAPEGAGGDTGARQAESIGGAGGLQQAPTHSIIPFDDAAIERIINMPAFLTREAQPFRAGELETVIPPQSVILPADMFMAAIITSSIEDRPIYFASTTQAYRKLNLSPLLIRRGVALKLSESPVEPDLSAGIVPMPSAYRGVLGAYVDVAVSDSLLWGVYQHHTGLPDEWTHWVDASTQGVPFYYWHAHLAAAAGHAALGEEEAVLRHQARMEEWSRLAELGAAP